jgi:signal transduction histidine kinase
MVHMTIRDNGKGISEHALKSGGGIGLASIREHTGAAGGILKISSGSDGTAIEISLPLTED